MKYKYRCVITLLFCLLSICLKAKTIHYVKSGATGDGSSWSNASGSIQDMIDKASPGDEVWVAKGTYIASSSNIDDTYYGPWNSRFDLKLGVSLFGGFKGTENNLQQREKEDRNGNGIIEPWEFVHETILSGYYAGKERVWLVDDEKNILEVVLDCKESSRNLLYYMKDGNSEISYSFDTYISGFTITGAQSACAINSPSNFVISDCEVCYNYSSSINNVVTRSYGHKDINLSITNSAIHHNLLDGHSRLIIYVNNCTDCMIHHNVSPQCVNCLTISNSEVYKNRNSEGIAFVSTAYNCKFYQNIGGEVWVGSVDGNVGEGLHNCEIYQNEGDGVIGPTHSFLCNSLIYENKGRGVSGTTAYNCHIFGNKDGGTYDGSFYNCIIESNFTQKDGGGTISSNLYDCIVRDNFAVGNGGGTNNGLLKNCKIYNNEALGKGGGVYGGTAINCSIFNNKAGEEGGGYHRGNDGYCCNCDIYNNYAPAYGGAAYGYYTNCTIVNNKSFSGNENDGSLTNCILVGTFDGSASYSAFTDSYVKGDGNFLATEKELKFVKSTSFTGNASNEKQFEELKNVDFRLSKGSSAIDMGQQKFGISLPPEDYSGYPRPMGVKTDIGAHEYPSYRVLPYENKFDESSLSMNVPEAWKVEKLSGKEEYSLYYAGDRYNSQKQFNYITTPFFDKTASNKINLSFDISAKFKTMDQKEKMHIILAYLESDKRDTIMSYSNTDYIQDIRFSKEISSWVKNKVFRVLFAVEDSQRESYYGSNILYSGVSNLKISKQDATVDIIAKDKVCMYDGKPQSVDFQINDTRVDKNKAVVIYQKEGSTQSSTTLPTNAGVYKVLISIEDGSYFGVKEVKLTIEKANQKILWEQKLTTMGTLEKIRLKATASSGLPVQYSVDDELLAKIEKIDNDWWLVSDTLIGNVTVKASQPGNENYNLANSVLKTIKVYSNLTDIAEIETNNLKAYYLKESNSIRIEGAPIGCKVYVYDTLGHLYTSKEIIYGEDQIQMRNTSGGIYYLLFVDKDKKRTIKVLTD